MKLYIVTETNSESKTLLRTWVCFTKEQAMECLKFHYNVSCKCCSIRGVDNPTDCTDQGFFFYEMEKDFKVKYSIEESETFA